MKKIIITIFCFIFLFIIASPVLATTQIPFTTTFADASATTVIDLTGQRQFYLTAVACKEISYPSYDVLNSGPCNISGFPISGVNYGIISATADPGVSFPYTVEGFLIGDYIGGSSLNAIDDLSTIAGSIVNQTVSLSTVIFEVYWPFVLVIFIILSMLVVFRKLFNVWK